MLTGLVLQACQELASLEISNLSSRKQFTDQSVQRSHLNLKSSQNVLNDPVKDDAIKKLEWQLSKCSKENSDLQNMITSLHVEKQELLLKIDTLQQALGVSAHDGLKQVNSLTLPKKFAVKSENVYQNDLVGPPPLPPPRIGSTESVSFLNFLIVTYECM